MTPSREKAVILAQLALLATAYYLAVSLGLGFRFQNSGIGVVWPSNAVLVSALLLMPRRRWWLAFAVTALVHMIVMYELAPVWRWLWQIAGNSFYAAVAAWALARFVGFPVRLDSTRQVVVYAALAFVLPMMISFISPPFVRSLLDLEFNGLSPETFLRTTLSNTTAMLLVTPAILLWAQGGFRRLRELDSRRMSEAVAIMVVQTAAGLFVFFTGPEIARFPSLLLCMFPPLLWAAFRFGPLGSATSLLYVASLSIWGSAQQLGPFVLMDDTDRVLSLQTFWVVLSLPVMLIAAVMQERQRVEHALLEQRNQLAHVMRVNTVGELSGALAHELRQPLTAMLANAQAGIELLKNSPADLDEMREILQDVVQQNQQAESFIVRLRSFLKKDSPSFEAFELDTVVRDAVKLGRSAIRYAGVEVETQIDAGLPCVRGDRVQLLQVMLNLIVNGCESMRGVPARERRLQLRVRANDCNQLEVLVIDSGVGLPQEESLVFQPFFTTRENGLGLGLAISQSITAAHGGQLWCENNARGGATFHLVLPSDTDEAHQNENRKR